MQSGIELFLYSAEITLTGEPKKVGQKYSLLLSVLLDAFCWTEEEDLLGGQCLVPLFILLLVAHFSLNPPRG